MSKQPTCITGTRSENQHSANLKSWIKPALIPVNELDAEGKPVLASEANPTTFGPS